MTENLRRFIEANKKHGVVAGKVLGKNGVGGGARYSLTNGKSFTLTEDECKELGNKIQWDY